MKEEEKKEALNKEQLKQANGGVDIPAYDLSIKKIPSLQVEPIDINFDMTVNKQSQAQKK